MPWCWSKRLLLGDKRVSAFMTGILIMKTIDLYDKVDDHPYKVGPLKCSYNPYKWPYKWVWGCNPYKWSYNPTYD